MFFFAWWWYQSPTWMEGIVEQRCAWPSACPSPNRCGQRRRHSRLRTKIGHHSWATPHSELNKPDVTRALHVHLQIHANTINPSFTIKHIPRPETVRFASVSTGWPFKFRTRSDTHVHLQARVAPHQPSTCQGTCAGFVHAAMLRIFNMDLPRDHNRGGRVYPQPTGLLHQLWPAYHWIKPCGKTLDLLDLLTERETLKRPNSMNSVVT